MFYFHITTMAQTVNSLQYIISLSDNIGALSPPELWLSPQLPSWRAHFLTIHTGRQGQVIRSALTECVRTEYVHLLCPVLNRKSLASHLLSLPFITNPLPFITSWNEDHQKPSFDHGEDGQCPRRQSNLKQTLDL